MERDDDPLAALLGRTRVSILRLTAVPLWTTQIARQLGQSPGSVSQHLSVLRGGGLVFSRRSGRSVLYRQTTLSQSTTAAPQVASRSAQDIAACRTDVSARAVGARERGPGHRRSAEQHP